MKKRCAFSALGVVFVLVGSSEAALIGLDLQDTPDIFSSFIDVSYDATLDTFLVAGESLSYDDDGIGPAATIFNGSFDIAASVNSFGHATSGTITIGGDIPDLGVIGPTLLTGSIVDFGFEDPPGGMLFEFLFAVTGGDLASDYGGAGALFGVVLDINSNVFDGTWLSDFQTTGGAGVSDARPLVPAPATLALLALGPFMLARRRRGGA